MEAFALIGTMEISVSYNDGESSSPSLQTSIVPMIVTGAGALACGGYRIFS